MNVTEEQVNECTDILRTNGVYTEKFSWSDLEDITKSMYQFAELQIARNGKSK